MSRMGKMGKSSVGWASPTAYLTQGRGSRVCKGNGEEAEFKIQNSRAALGAKHLAVTLQPLLLILLQMLCPNQSSTVVVEIPGFLKNPGICARSGQLQFKNPTLQTVLTPPMKNPTPPLPHPDCPPTEETHPVQENDMYKQYPLENPLSWKLS